MRFSKSHEETSDTKKFLTGERKPYFKDGFPKDGWVTYRSNKRKKLNNGNWDSVYKNILKELLPKMSIKEAVSITAKLTNCRRNKIYSWAIKEE